MAVTAKTQTSRRDKFSSAAKNAVSEAKKQPVEISKDVVKDSDQDTKVTVSEPETSKTAIVKTKTKASTKEKKAAAKSKTGKTGRPAGQPTYKVLLAIPEESKEAVETASLFYKGSVTRYINSLIKKDLEQNSKKYQEFKELLEKE